MTVTGFLAVLAIVTLGADQAEGAPGDDPPPSPLFSMEFQNMPSDTMIYPTCHWWNKVSMPGILTIENYRPEDVYIYLNVSIDNGWFVTINPLMYVVGTSRYDTRTFRVYLHVPPNTVGPGVSVLTIGALAKIPTRTLAEINASIDVHFLSNVDEMVDGTSSILFVDDTDRLVTDRMRLCNLLDRPQEFHICAMGEWEERIPDLDFHSGGVLLQPQEMRVTVFRGYLVEDVEPGVYQVDMAIWTPDGEGGRLYVLNWSVEMEVFTMQEDIITSIIVSGFGMLVISCAICTVVVAWIFKVQHRRSLARLDGQYPARDQNGYHE
jgi:hypothetical protein